MTLRPVVSFALALLALLVPLPAAAQDAPGSLAGSWALQIGGATIFRFDLEPVPGEDEWRGTWTRPSSFASDGDNFAELTLPPRRLQSMAGFEADGGVEVSFPDPRPGAIPDIFRFRLIDRDAVEMTYVGTELAPYTLERVAPDTALGPFRDGATYSRAVPEEPAPEEPEVNPSTRPAPSIEPDDVLDEPASAEDFRLPPSGIQGR